MIEVSITDRYGTRVVSFVRWTVVIGRDPGADIVLDRRGVAPRHLQIVRRDDRLLVFDLRRPLRDSLVVEPADVIRVAGIDLRAAIRATMPTASGDEAELLAAIRERPDDVATRAVYADWLEERGHRARAEFLRTQLAVHDAGDPADPAYLAAQPRLAELAPQVGEAWRARVATAFVERCDQRTCRWDRLTATEDDDVRECTTCQSRVTYHVTLPETFRELRGRVVLDVLVTRRP